MRTFPRWTAISLLCLIGSCPQLRAGGSSGDDDPEAFFELKVRPVLAGTCVKCHGEKKASGGLRLDSREAMLAGGESGPAVVPGDPKAQPAGPGGPPRGRHRSRCRPSKPLPATAQDDLAAWVAAGAPWPKAAAAPADRRAGALGLRAAADRRAARRPDRLGLAADRPAHRRRAPGQRAAPRRAGRPPDPDPPGVLRPDRPAARARAGRGVRRPTSGPTPSPAWSTSCSPRPATASAGDATGSTSPATPTPPATTPTTRSPRRTSIATT